MEIKIHISCIARSELCAIVIVVSDLLVHIPMDV